MKKLITKEILNELLETILVEVNDEWFSEKQIKRLEMLVKYDLNIMWKGLEKENSKQ